MKFNGSALTQREKDIAGAVLAASTFVMNEEKAAFGSQTGPVCGSVMEILGEPNCTAAAGAFAHEFVAALRALPRRKSMLAQMCTEDDGAS